MAVGILSTGSMAMFGGDNNTTSTDSDEELAPVGSAPGDMDMGSSQELMQGPGVYEEQTTSDSTTAAYPGMPIETFKMNTWTVPSTTQQTYLTQPINSPIGAMTPTYESTVGAYYTSVAPPVAQQKVLIGYNVASAPPAAVFYNAQLVSWPTFQATFQGTMPLLWISTYNGWQWYAVCPSGAWVTEMMYVPRTGPVKLYEIYPDGTTKTYNYGWASVGYKYLWFYADTQGRHIAIFTVSDVASNAVTIDVV